MNFQNRSTDLQALLWYLLMRVGVFLVCFSSLFNALQFWVPPATRSCLTTTPSSDLPGFARGGVTPSSPCDFSSPEEQLPVVPSPTELTPFRTPSRVPLRGQLASHFPSHTGNDERFSNAAHPRPAQPLTRRQSRPGGRRGGPRGRRSAAGTTQGPTAGEGPSWNPSAAEQPKEAPRQPRYLRAPPPRASCRRAAFTTKPESCGRGRRRAERTTPTSAQRARAGGGAAVWGRGPAARHGTARHGCGGGCGLGPGDAGQPAPPCGRER